MQLAIGRAIGVEARAVRNDFEANKQAARSCACLCACILHFALPLLFSPLLSLSLPSLPAPPPLLSFPSLLWLLSPLPYSCSFCICCAFLNPGGAPAAAPACLRSHADRSMMTSPLGHRSRAFPCSAAACVTPFLVVLHRRTRPSPRMASHALAHRST